MTIKRPKPVPRVALVVTAGLALLMLPQRAAATILDHVEACVDDTGLHFAVTLRESSAEAVLRIGADDDPFGGDTERIAVNFDPASGAITRQAPIVEPSGTPPHDRWLDGLIANWSLTPAPGVGGWRFEGGVPHGADRFQAGDTLWGVSLRGAITVSVHDVPITDCSRPATAIRVPSTPFPPHIDGKLRQGEWSSAAIHELAGGELRLVHDATRLYMLFDMTADATDDPAFAGGFDQVWVHFDVDEDGAVTPNLDRRYREENVTGNLRYETYCDGCLLGFNPPAPSTYSARALGFGCFSEDGSLTRTGCSEHRLWELAIDLEEIAARSDRSARMGYLVQSNAATVVAYPEDLNDLASYVPLALEGLAAGGAAGEPAVQTGLEVTQGVQRDDNSLPLVAGRRTVVRAFLTRTSTADAGAIVTVKGRRGGVDLPGSPLAAFATAALVPDTSVDTVRSDDDNSIEWVLPESWTSGDVALQLELRRPWIPSATGSSPLPISFVEADTPTYWMVPVDVGTAGRPNRPHEAFMDDVEEAARELFPVPDINFVRRPPLLTGPTDSPTLTADLNELFGQAVLAWTVGLVFTGTPPFQLPDQIIGVTVPALCTDPPTCARLAGGSSDPVWFHGDGRVCWISERALNGDYVLAHEVNHNLDTDPAGTWGRHVPTPPSSSNFCQTATGPDPAWPYPNEQINDWGFRRWTQINSPAGWEVIDDTTPDVMSYCTASGGPAQWISPYRWQAELGNVFSASAARARRRGTRQDVQDTLYVSGLVPATGGGYLDPVLQQPGVAQPAGSVGSHALVVRDCGGAVLAEDRFTPGFEDVEGGAGDVAFFSRRIGAPAGACSVALTEGSEVLSERVLSPHPPVVTVLSPNGGEAWEGPQLIEWHVEDADGNKITSTVLYSPDDGATWLPVAGGLSGTSYAVDSDTLPGTSAARVRVIATDGFNTASDDSDGSFAVALQPPEPVILEPGPVPALPAGPPVELHGLARDSFGAPLPEEQLEWELDGGLLGIGERATVWLAPGEHVLTLRATPSEGPAGEVSLSFTAAAGLIFTDGFDRGGLRAWSTTVADVTK